MGALFQDRLADWTVGRNITLPLILTCSSMSCHPCGGGVEYLHRSPASCRKQRKRKSQIWDSKIWSRVPKDSDPRKTTLARSSSIYKRQTRPLIREDAPQKPDRNCQRVINIWPWAADGGWHQDLLIDWPSVAMWLCSSVRGQVWSAHQRATVWRISIVKIRYQETSSENIAEL
jgi:hypothetical protein